MWKLCIFVLRHLLTLSLFSSTLYCGYTFLARGSFPVKGDVGVYTSFKIHCVEHPKWGLRKFIDKSFVEIFWLSFGFWGKCLLSWVALGKFVEYLMEFSCTRYKKTFVWSFLFKFHPTMHFNISPRMHHHEKILCEFFWMF